MAQHKNGAVCQIDGCQAKPVARGFCKTDYAHWYLEHSAPCTEPDCERPSWSAGLCQTHYRYYLRHRPPETGWHRVKRQSDWRPGGGYDVRFCTLLIAELKMRKRPRYPQPSWFGALSVADYQYRELGPPLKPLPKNGHFPEVAGVPENQRALYANYGAYSAEGVLKSVDQACTRWLRSHGGLTFRGAWTPEHGRA